MRKEQKKPVPEDIIREFLSVMKTHVGQLSGKNLSVSKIALYLESTPGCHVCDMAYILNHPLVATSSRWQAMRKQFNKQYEKEITFHYDLQIRQEKQISIAKEAVMEIAYKFGEMKSEGLFGDCSFQDIADIIGESFNLPVQLSTFQVYMKQGAAHNRENPEKK